MFNCYCLKCEKDYQQEYSQSAIGVGETEYGTFRRVLCPLCGGDAKIMGVSIGGLDPLTPYWSENMDKHPILIESRSHRRQLMKERHLEIMPYKKHDKFVPRDRSGHKMTAHQLEKAQMAGFNPR